MPEHQLCRWFKTCVALQELLLTKHMLKLKLEANPAGSLEKLDGSLTKYESNRSHALRFNVN